jgi:hypothetical protein
MLLIQAAGLSSEHCVWTHYGDAIQAHTRHSVCPSADFDDPMPF